MAYNIVDIEGIGFSYGAKLEVAEVKTTDQRLAQAGSAKVRSELAVKTGIAEGNILRGVNHAD